MRGIEWQTPLCNGEQWKILCIQTEDKEPRLISLIEHREGDKVETTQVNATNYQIDLNQLENLVGELVDYIIDSMRLSGETDEAIYQYLNQFGLGKQTWSILVDYENNAENWWKNGGHRLWKDYIQGVNVKKGSVIEVLLSLPDKNRLLKRAESIVGWNDGPEYAKHPLIILSGDKEQQK